MEYERLDNGVAPIIDGVPARKMANASSAIETGVAISARQVRFQEVVVADPEAAQPSVGPLEDEDGAASQRSDGSSCASEPDELRQHAQWRRFCDAARLCGRRSLAAIRALLPICVYYADVATDLRLCLTLLMHTSQATFYPFAILLSMCAQYFAAWLCVLVWAWRHFRLDLAKCPLDRACWEIRERPGVSGLFLLLLALGFPLAPLSLDLLMPLSPLGVLDLLPSPAFSRFTPTLSLGQLRFLLPAYAAARIVLEASLESLPMALLHSSCALGVVGADGLGGTTDVSDQVHSELRAAQVQALGTSVLHLVLVGYRARCALREAGAARWLLRLQSLLGLGVDIPVDSLRAGALREWRAPYGIFSTSFSTTSTSDPGATGRLGEALGEGRGGLRRLDLAGSGLDDVSLGLLCQGFARRGALADLQTLTLSGNRIGDDGLRCLAGVVCAHGALPSLETLTLSGNEIGSAGVSALAVLAVQGTEEASRTSKALASLRTLLLANNEIGDAGVEAFCRAFAQGAFPQLQLLHLGGNLSISDAARRDIEAALAASSGGRAEVSGF
jgi:hypothetical protein